MDIALETISNARRFTGAPNQPRPNYNNAPRGNMPNNNNQYFEEQQTTQYPPQGRRFNPNHSQPPQQPNNTNYRSPPQREYREQAPNYPQKHQNYGRQEYQEQQEYNQPRQPPPRFPPPPPREPRQQRQQDQYEGQDDRQQTAMPYQRPPRRFQQEQGQGQGRFDRRQGYRQEANDQQEEARPYRQQNNQRRGQQYDRNDRNQNQPNQRMPPNERMQPDRNYRQDQRQPPMQRGEYEERGRGRGRGGSMDRGRGRGRGRGRQISRAIQESEFHNLPPIKKPQQQKAQPVSEQESGSGSGSGSESGSQQMSQEEYEQSRSASQSQSQARDGSVMERSQSVGGSIEEGSGEQRQSVSEMESSQRAHPRNIPAVAQSPQSFDSLNLQQIHTMCSKEQFNERLETFITNNRNLEEGMMRLDTGRSFAIFEINKKTGEPDYALALKRYRRSTNRSEDQDEKDEESDLPRSRTGLIKAMAHIMKEIIDADNVKERDLAFPLPPGESKIQFLHIFDFLWNRMREMIKDVSRLDLKERSSGDVITICEQMLRFFIIATREGKLPHACRLQFDPKLNLQSITKILTQLMEIYDESHMKLHKDSNAKCYISANQPEIIAYAIIISNDIQKTLNEKVMVRLNGQGLDHPLLASSEIATALRVKKALKNRDYETYYQILEDDATDYVLSCLLLHHLPIVRRETLRVIHKAAPADANKVKRIPEEAFRHALRFKSKQHQDFKEFLRQIRATISNQNGQSFVLLPPMEENLQSTSILSNYLFDTNKMLRNRYDLKPITKRLSNPNIISRQELTKRIWFQGKYAALAKRYYHSQQGQEEEQEEQEQEQSEQSKQQMAPPMPSKKEERKEPDVLAEKSPGSPVPAVDGNKINFLLMKRKQLERNKFLKNLEGLIQNLIKNSDIHSQHKRKKGLQTMLQLADLARVLALDSAFARLADFSTNKKMAQQAILQLQRYKKIKEEFENAYNKSAFQFQRKNGEKAGGKMSLLLNQARRPKEQGLLKKLHSIYQEEQGQQPAQRRLRTLYIFTSDPRKGFTQSQRAFLVNFFLYMALANSKKPQPQLLASINKLLDGSGDTSLQFMKKMGKTDEAVLQYSFTFFHYRSTSDIPFLSGYDAVVFLDLWRSVSAFHALIKDFQQNRKKLFKNQNKPAPTSLQECLVLHMGSGDGAWQSGTISEYQRQVSKKEHWESSWHRLQVQAMRISPSLKITLNNFLSSQIRKALPPQQQFAVYSFAQLIDQIQRNLQCISGEQLKQDVSSLQFLQTYFNANLQCLRRAVMQTTLYYQTQDWRDILLEASFSHPPPYKYLTFPPPQEPILHDDKPQGNPNSQLGRKLLFSLEMLSSLRLSLSAGYAQAVRDGTGDGIYVLSHLLQNYLQGLQSKQLEEHFSCLAAYVIQTNCRLVLTETVGGDCKGLFLFMLGQLKIKLQLSTLILPRDFQFRIPRSALIRQEQKQEEALVKSLLQRGPSPYNRKELKYCRSELLSRLLKQIQEEQEEGEVQAVGASKKAVKTR